MFKTNSWLKRKKIVEYFWSQMVTLLHNPYRYNDAMVITNTNLLSHRVCFSRVELNVISFLKNGHRARSLVQEVKQNICLAFTSLLVWNCVSGVAMQCQKCFLYFVVLWRKIVFSMGSLSLLRSPRKCLFNKVFAKFISKFA